MSKRNHNETTQNDRNKAARTVHRVGAGALAVLMLTIAWAPTVAAGNADECGGETAFTPIIIIACIESGPAPTSREHPLGSELPRTFGPARGALEAFHGLWDDVGGPGGAWVSADPPTCPATHGSVVHRIFIDEAGGNFIDHVDVPALVQFGTFSQPLWEGGRCTVVNRWCSVYAPSIDTYVRWDYAFPTPATAFGWYETLDPGQPAYTANVGAPAALFDCDHEDLQATATLDGGTKLYVGKYTPVP